MYLSKTKVMRAKLQKIRYIVEHCAIFIFSAASPDDGSLVAVARCICLNMLFCFLPIGGIRAG